jgi:methyl-accepting chemotaxis protein
MPVEPPKERLLRLLRRSPRSAHAAGERDTADVSALWSAHGRALVRARDAGAAAQRIASSVARQRASIDAVADRVRALSSRAGEAQAGFTRIVDAFERLALVALNAGLEGARLGEGEGRQLGLVGDEVRAHAARGAEAARELGAGLAQLGADMGQLDANIALAQGVVAEVTQDSARALGAASDAESALMDVGERVKKATGSDPETVRAIAEVSERARSLVTSLTTLSGKAPRALIAAAMRPALEPLVRLLTEDAPRHEGEPD